MSLGVLPLIQLDCQKLVLSPFPTLMIVDALNKSLSLLSQGMSRSTHGLSTCFHLNQSHLNLSARAKRSRSKTPSPPRYFGVHTVGQLTRQWPPLTLSGSSPFHRKLRLILSIYFSIHFCIGNTVKWYIGCGDSTLLTSVSLPAMNKSLPFHAGMRPPILSSRGCTSIRLSLRMCNGSPQYLPGNFPILPGKLPSIVEIVVSSQRIGKISVLFRLTLSPEQLPKRLRTCVMWYNSAWSGFAKIAASSA